MCGIFATTRPDLWRTRVPEIMRALHHRGPDDCGSWESEGGEVLLVHTRLAVIGLGPEGKQPATISSAHALVLNGEIYNYRELIAEFRISATTSDSRVLIDLLARQGCSALSRLRGMYAFSWWNGVTRTLLAARDPWGIKPL